MNSSVFEYFRMIAGYSPVLLAYVVGAIVAAVQWRKQPRPALFVMLAVVIQLLASLAQPAIHLMIIHASDASASDRSSMFMVVGLVFGLAHVISFSLLVAAAFVRRSTPPPAVPFSAPYSG